MSTGRATGNRLRRLRKAREITDELSDELGEQGKNQIQHIRSKLQLAGSNIRSAGYNRYMEDAMGKVAGIAIGSGYDDLADRATRVLDDDIEFESEPLETVERETDDRGRVTLGREYAEQRVTVAVLAAEDVTED